MKKALGSVVQSPIFWLTLLSLVYFITRLVNLTSLPIFTDEAIYIRWAQIGAQDASWRFISLTDGKQPLFAWLMMVMVRFIKDPLLAGRFASVISGWIGMIGMFFLGREIFKSKRIGLISSALYVICPFAVFYDRMALYDSLVAACSIWNLYFSILLVRRVRLDVALILGMTLGLGMLNKTSGFLSLYCLPFTLLLFDWKKQERWRRLLTWFGLALLAAGLSQVIYSILRLSPFFYIIAQKDTIFVYPMNEWITHPFRFLQGNLHGMFDWLTSYLSWSVVGLCIFSCLIFWKKLPEKILLVLWWLVPFVGLALFGSVLYPRFILFMTMPLLVLAAYGIETIWDMIPKKIIAAVLIFFILFFNLRLSYEIIYDIKNAPITKSDQGQYINDWPSGWGVKEVVEFAKNQSAKEKIRIFTEGTFGLFPYALEIYLVDNKNIEIVGFWPMTDKIPDVMLESAKERTTYFVTNLTQNKPNWPLTFVSAYKKGSNDGSQMQLYQVTPE